MVKSSKPKKQRKAHYGRALHKRQQGLSAHLDKKLRKQLETRSVSLRKGDSVKVMRGAKKGASGKVTAVNYLKGVIFIDKLVRKKANGEEIALPVNASNVLVTELEKSDEKRFKGKKLAGEEKRKEEGKKSGKLAGEEKRKEEGKKSGKGGEKDSEKKPAKEGKDVKK